MERTEDTNVDSHLLASHNHWIGWAMPRRLGAQHSCHGTSRDMRTLVERYGTMGIEKRTRVRIRTTNNVDNKKIYALTLLVLPDTLQVQRWQAANRLRRMASWWSVWSLLRLALLRDRNNIQMRAAICFQWLAFNQHWIDFGLIERDDNRWWCRLGREANIRFGVRIQLISSMPT